MSVPMIVLALVAMVTAMTASLRDHAALAAATDLAHLRVEHAADAYVMSCLTHDGCARPEGVGLDACAASDTGVIITARVDWEPSLWKGLTPATADRIVAYDDGLGAQFRARAASGLDAC